MRLGKILIIATACAAFSAPAEARPRLLGVVRALTGPVAFIAGAAAARARVRHHNAAAAPRPDAAEIRPEKRVAIASWAGPLFWPYAYDDIIDYVFGQREATERFWAHGYGDVLDGMFVSASVERQRGQRVAMQVADNANVSSPNAAPSWQSMCGSQAPNPVDGLVERIRSGVQPTSEQASSLDVLKDALTNALGRIQTACPAASANEATDRLDLMSARLRAMRQAAIIVLTPLKNFYATLSDDQKTRFNNLNSDPTNSTDPASVAVTRGPSSCVESEETANWPATRIARRVTPKRDQFADLEVLRQTSAALGKFVASTCGDNKAQTPPDRLDAAQKRLNVMRYAVTHVSPALDQFYGALSAKQKARFSSLGR
jgi:hypothetical protein